MTLASQAFGRIKSRSGEAREMRVRNWNCSFGYLQHNSAPRARAASACAISRHHRVWSSCFYPDERLASEMELVHYSPGCGLAGPREASSTEGQAENLEAPAGPVLASSSSFSPSTYKHHHGAIIVVRLWRCCPRVVRSDFRRLPKPELRRRILENFLSDVLFAHPRAFRAILRNVPKLRDCGVVAAVRCERLSHDCSFKRRLRSASTSQPVDTIRWLTSGG